MKGRISEISNTKLNNGERLKYFYKVLPVHYVYTILLRFSYDLRCISCSLRFYLQRFKMVFDDLSYH